MENWHMHPNTSINNYANSMFRFEILNDGWLKLCTAYLKYLFGDSIKGKTIIDYAFGRGNWSIAFLNVGAKEVIAIDAAEDNIKRFKSYCVSKHIKNISIIHGNVLKQDFDFKGDLLWLYGILHHLNQVDSFLNKIKTLLNQDGLIYAYFYNRNSLRQPIVEMCRELHVYPNEKEFLDDHYLYLRGAKNRASDDLVAPYIKWWKAPEAQNLLRKNGIYIKRQDIDCYEFLNKVENPEFYPHQFLCDLSRKQPIIPKERKHKFQEEIKVIILMKDEILKKLFKKAVRKKISIGIFNSYFVQINNNTDVKKAIIEVYLYLARIIIYNVDLVKLHNKLVSGYLKLTISSLKDDPKKNHFYQTLGKNVISTYLVENRIRL